MIEDIYWNYRKIKESYWVEKLENKPTCEDCTKYECPLPGESEELSNKLRELVISSQSKKYRTMSLLDYSKAVGKSVSDVLKDKEENQIRECLKKKAEVDDKIQNCMNRRTYVAIKKGANCFISQHLWGISDCHTCEYYIVGFSICVCNSGRTITHTKGLCPLYKFGEPMGFKDVYATG